MSHYAEWLTQRVFGGELAVHSNPAYDLLDKRNRRIQVKARVSRIAKGQAGIVERRSSRGLSVKTDNIGDFDYLVLVVFLPETFDVALALGVPNDIFRKIGKKSGDGVRRRLPSGESIRNIEGVDDLTRYIHAGIALKRTGNEIVSYAVSEHKKNECR